MLLYLCIVKNYCTLTIGLTYITFEINGVCNLSILFIAPSLKNKFKIFQCGSSDLKQKEALTIIK